MPEKQSGRLVLVRAGQSAAVPQDLGSEPGVGQIRSVGPDRGADMHVLVVEVHEQHVHAMLCGEECELATDTDAVLEPDITGLSRRILVHGDVSGSILKRRLGRAVGQIEPDLAERIALRGRGLDFTATDLGRGTSIADDSDPRWEWKMKQHRQLRRVRARASELGWEIYKLGPREE
jgi:hypothetical protein